MRTIDGVNQRVDLGHTVILASSIDGPTGKRVIIEEGVQDSEKYSSIFQKDGHWNVLISWQGAAENADDPYAIVLRGEENANGIAAYHDEIRKFRLEQDKVKRDFEKKYIKPVDQEGKLLKRLNKALNKFVNNNVKTLHKGMDDEVTEL